MIGTRVCRMASLVVALMGVVGIALSVSAGDSLSFKGRAGEAITHVEPVADGLLVTTTGSGEATYLGRFTREVTGVIHPDGTVEGTVVFTAANGDRLSADIDGAFASPTSIIGTYTFTGGTGRFSGASGEAEFEAVTLDGIHFALSFEGDIKF